MNNQRRVKRPFDNYAVVTGWGDWSWEENGMHRVCPDPKQRKQ